MKESIQETLQELSFSEDQAGGCFCRGSLQIPFAALCGHSLETFLKMAQKRGWIMEEEVREVLDPQPRHLREDEGQGLSLSPCEECRGSGWDKRKKSGCLSCLGKGVVWRMPAKAH